MILPIPLLAVVLLSLAPYVSCQELTSNQTLMEVLAGIPECQEYFKLLQRYPDAQSPPPGPLPFTVFCPSNEAVIRKLAEPAGSIFKRDDPKATSSMAANTATGVSVTKPARPPVTPAPRARAKRQVTSSLTGRPTVVVSFPTAAGATTTGTASATPGSSPAGSPAASTAVSTNFRTSGPDPFALDPNQLTLKTTLDNPEVVNLGPGAFLPMVSFTQAPSVLGLACGLGEVVNVNPRSIPFDRGEVRVSAGFVTLPETISQSLTFLAQRTFLEALRRFNLLSLYETTPLITAFVPIDSSLSGELSECTCKHHIIRGPPLYTPDIELGRAYTTDAGGTITIEIKDGVYTLTGGAVIEKANVITKNGVVHLIKGNVSGICEPMAFTGGSSRVGAWAGGLVGLVGVVVGLLA
ncbi:hypothetical protein HOY82DRAFT_480505 [Tuber indicum]|nr:hypothetical protein HOY82DRAFT_480505 [Tuber indicum]